MYFLTVIINIFEKRTTIIFKTSHLHLNFGPSHERYQAVGPSDEHYWAVGSSHEHWAGVPSDEHYWVVVPSDEHWDEQ